MSKKTKIKPVEEVYLNDMVVEEIDAMVERMQTPEAKKALHEAFNATPKELGEAAVRAARKDSELMEPLPEIVGKVFTEENAKTYTFKADVFRLDDENQLARRHDYTDCKLQYSSPTRVFNDNGKLIGSVLLEVQGNALVGEFFLDYATPERLNIETRSMPLYPHLDSYCEVAQVGHLTKATLMTISGVILGMSPTLDQRIEPV